ncbi:MAG: RecX family transcriptional regulator [Defluviitaleaceae bacterium]|nr:RecX family transcriptional regulator [Defluviitaleaceae bacterium]
MLSKETPTYVVVISCTALKKGHYQVELGDAEGEIYSWVVTEETLLAYRLVVGKELDKSTFDELQAARGYQAAYRYAIGILARRMYTEKDIRRKLSERKTADHVIEDVVAKLKENDLLNDEAYATFYIESQVEMGKKSRRRIISDLQAKGISTVLIDQLADLFSKTSENELIVKEIERAYRRYSRQGLTAFELKHKVVQALGRKGFDYDRIHQQYLFFIEDLAVTDA